MNNLLPVIKKRIFIVGTPRSGTTLLQNLLVQDERIHSFPETHFFSKTKPKKGSLRYKLGLPTKNAREYLTFFYREINEISFAYKQLFYIYNRKKYSKFFFKTLDTITGKLGKNTWIEKTPIHLHYIEDIESLNQDAHFIHIVRDPVKVAASIYEVTNKYPQHWYGTRTESECIQRWIHDIRITENYINKPNHYLIKYEELVQNVEGELQKLYKFLGLENRRDNLDKEKKIVLSTDSEVWKQNSFNQVSKDTENKFLTIFDEKQRRTVITTLLNSNIDLRKYVSDASMQLISKKS